MREDKPSNARVVTPKSWLDTHLIHAYLLNKYKNNNNVLVIPLTNASSFHDFYLGTVGACTQEQRDKLTDIIIPFHMEPFKHFTLMHVKYLGEQKTPVIYWLDSLGKPMPLKIKETANAVFMQKDKVIHEQAILNQQTDGYDCGVYLALNADLMVRNNDAEAIVNNSMPFITMTAEQSIALRKEIVAMANEETPNRYAFVESELGVKDEAARHWDKNTFINEVSGDLLAFGASIQDTEGAYDAFDQAFDIAAVAFNKANAAYATNRYAFFTAYQGLTVKASASKVSGHLIFEGGRHRWCTEGLRYR